MSTQTVEPSEKTLAHELIDRMGPEHLSAAVDYLQSIVNDPVLRAAAEAPFEDEPLKPEFVASIEEAAGDKEGWIKQEELDRQLGL